MVDSFGFERSYQDVRFKLYGLEAYALVGSRNTDVDFSFNKINEMKMEAAEVLAPLIEYLTSKSEKIFNVQEKLEKVKIGNDEVVKFENIRSKITQAKEREFESIKKGMLTLSDLPNRNEEKIIKACKLGAAITKEIEEKRLTKTAVITPDLKINPSLGWTGSIKKKIEQIQAELFTIKDKTLSFEELISLGARHAKLQEKVTEQLIERFVSRSEPEKFEALYQKHFSDTLSGTFPTKNNSRRL